MFLSWLIIYQENHENICICNRDSIMKLAYRIIKLKVFHSLHSVGWTMKNAISPQLKKWAAGKHRCWLQYEDPWSRTTYSEDRCSTSNILSFSLVFCVLFNIFIHKWLNDTLHNGGALSTDRSKEIWTTKIYRYLRWQPHLSKRNELAYA